MDSAKDIICELRHTEIVEDAYLNTQIRIAIEFFNKRGAEGQTAHSENGIGRTYSKADVSDDLLAKITPMARTPFSTVRVIV